MRTLWIEVGGRRLRALVQGRRDPFLLLWPGLGVAADAFRRFLREGPREGVSVLALDPPDHGRSDAFDRLGEDDVARVWRAAMEAVGAEKAVLGGHSYGAWAALIGLLHLPRRVSGIVLLDGGYPMGPARSRDAEHAENARFLRETTFPSWEAFLDEARRGVPLWDDDAAAAARSLMQERDGRIVYRISLQGLNQATDLIRGFEHAKLGTRDLPALLVRGTLPPDLENAREAGAGLVRRHLPRLKIAALPRGGHEILLDCPQDTARAVWEFLRGLKADPRPPGG